MDKIIYLFFSALFLASCTGKPAQTKDYPAISTAFINKYPKFESDSIFDTFSIDQEAGFPGGDRELFKYLATQGLGIELKLGTVDITITNFIIEQDGSIKEIAFVKETSPQFSEKIRNVLLHSPNWLPALSEGKLVRSKMSLPLIEK